MSLLDLKRYMQQHQFANIDAIAKDLDLTEDAVAHMMAHLERKGLVKKLSGETGCKSCSMGCQASSKVLYCWCRKPSLEKAYKQANGEINRGFDITSGDGIDNEDW